MTLQQILKIWICDYDNLEIMSDGVSLFLIPLFFMIKFMIIVKTQFKYTEGH